MSHKEVNQVAVFEQLKLKQLKQKQAAKQLGLSIHQVKRKLKAYRINGAASLVHAARGKPGNRSLDGALRGHSLGLVKQHYPDFAPTLAAEKLDELHGLVIDHETLRRWMTQAGLWQSKQRKVNPHVWRERRAAFGELIQLDGSPHAWFEDRGSQCTLLAFIDDATSQILWLEFGVSESTFSLMRATDHYLRIHGRPLELYTDRGGVFKVNIHNQNEDKLTQYERAIGELEIKFIHARSPQAKGRVERLFGTLQDRLVKELRLAGISTIPEANRFVQKTYMPKHNAKFAVEAREPQNLHRSISGYDLARVLVTKEERRINQDLTVQYKTQWFQVTKQQPTLVFPKNKITVSEHFTGQISLTLRMAQLNFQVIPKRPEKLTKARRQVQQLKQPWAPPPTHPWRQYKQKVPFLTS